MRVLVCGGRRYADEPAMERVLDAVCHSRSTVPYVIVHGAAVGADQMAGSWARSRGVAEAAFPADWGRDGRAAGPIRNQRMLDEGRPDLVVAFPGGRGTADMVRRARAAGVAVVLAA